MKTLRRHEAQLQLARCACGAVPCNHITHEGDVRLYQVTCSCGLATEKSESWPDVVSEWNEGRAVSEFDFPAVAMLPPPVKVSAYKTRIADGSPGSL